MVLAAELGKSLLEHNMKLKSSYDSLLKMGTPPITPSSSTNTVQEANEEDDDEASMRFIPSRTTREAMIEVLERKNTELTAKLEEAMIEQENMARSNSKKTRQLESEIDLLKSNLDIASAKIQELQEMNQRQKKLETSHSSSKNTETEALVDELYTEIDKVKQEKDAVLQSKIDLETKLTATLKDLSDLKKQFEKFEFTQHDFHELQEAYERQFKHIDELNHSLEDHRSILQKLKEKGINVHSTRSTPAPSVFGGGEDVYRKNTLLQELESEWLKSKSSVHEPNPPLVSTPSLVSSYIYQIKDLQEFKEKSLAAFYQAPSIGFESVLSKATGIDQQLLDETLDFIDKIEQEHNKEKCMVLYHNFMDIEEFDVEEDEDYPISDFYPNPLYECSQLQPYIPNNIQPKTLIGRLRHQIRKLFTIIWKWCRFAIVLTTALLINAWKGPDALLLTYNN